LFFKDCKGSLVDSAQDLAEMGYRVGKPGGMIRIGTAAESFLLVAEFAAMDYGHATASSESWLRGAESGKPPPGMRNDYLNDFPKAQRQYIMKHVFENHSGLSLDGLTEAQRNEMHFRGEAARRYGALGVAAYDIGRGVMKYMENCEAEAACPTSTFGEFGNTP
jgi:hypothetical protein